MHAAANALHQRGFTSLMLWVLKGNPTRGFYEHLGGRLFCEQMIEIGARVLGRGLRLAPHLTFKPVVDPELAQYSCWPGRWSANSPPPAWPELLS